VKSVALTPGWHSAPG